MTGASFTPSDLFNCCTNAAAPDWSQFDWLEIGGCCDVADDDARARGETCIEGGYSVAEAEFFTIYGHYAAGRGAGLDDITDCETFEKAQAVAAELARLSGLAVKITC